MVPVAQGRSFARAWMTEKAALPRWRALEPELLAECWLLELAQAPRELRKRRPEPRELLKLIQRLA